MKIFVFAYNRYKTMTSSRLLSKEGIPHIVLCHDAEAAAQFEKNGTIGETGSVVVTNRERGLTRQRNAALGMMEEGEWAVFMNDDLQRLEIRPQWFEAATQIDKADKRRPVPLSFTNFMHFAWKLVEAADAKTNLIAFASNENLMYLEKRQRWYGLADGRLWLLRKTKLRFDETVGTIEDHDWTAQNIETFGKVQVENWIIPHFQRWTEGGYGTIDERAKELRADCEYLMAKHPGLFAYKEKKGFPPHTQLRFKDTYK